MTSRPSVDNVVKMRKTMTRSVTTMPAEPGLHKDQNEQAGAEDFQEMGLSPIMLKALSKAGYTKPSPIQSKVIPVALDGFDILGQARTGTGKTAAFAIPILEQLDPLSEAPKPQALVLVPTRELATQVTDEFKKLAAGCPTSIVELAGGKPMNVQLRQLQRGVQVVVGTPGRVIDHMRRGSLEMSGLWCVVLDEADRMLDIGFRPDIERILRRAPATRQTLLLSATFDDEIRELTKRYLFEPVHIDCSSRNMSVDTIAQRYITAESDQKYDLLIKLLQREQPPQAIIFCRTKLGTARLHRKLEESLALDPVLATKQVETIHGNMTQPQRDKVFAKLRSGDIDILVATDVVGRGIDVSTISHIINFDLPQDSDDYVHRVGRTGRMGREGIAFSFVSREDGILLTDIEQRINRLLDKDELSLPVRGSEKRMAAAELAEEASDASDQESLNDEVAAKKSLFKNRRRVTRRR